MSNLLYEWVRIRTGSYLLKIINKFENQRVEGSENFDLLWSEQLQFEARKNFNIKKISVGFAKI